MKYVRGNLIDMGIDGTFDIIGQGCNAFCQQNAGIAREFRVRFPKVLEADCSTIAGDRTKMGTYTQHIETIIGPLTTTRELVILNCYTQYTTWDPNDMFDYDALKKVLIAIKQNFADWFKNDARIGFPLIGAGLARGDWKKIKQIFAEVDIPNCYIVVLFDKDWNSIVAPAWDDNDALLPLPL